MQEYTNKSEDFLGTQNKFIHRHDTKPIKLKPMNYYLCNRVTLPLLKKIYWDKTITKTDIENDNDSLDKFDTTYHKCRLLLLYTLTAPVYTSTVFKSVC